MCTLTVLSRPHGGCLSGRSGCYLAVGSQDSAGPGLGAARPPSQPTSAVWMIVWTSDRSYSYTSGWAQASNTTPSR